MLVKAIGKPRDSYWMRSSITVCAAADNPLALAKVFYQGADKKKDPTSTAWNDTTDPCTNDPLEFTEPYYKITPDPKPSFTQNITITGGFNETDHFSFRMNDVAFRANFNKPVLLLAHQKNFTFEPQWNVYNFGANRTVRLIIKNDFPAAHPMHLHGHNMFVMYVGPGLDWNGTIVRPENPQRRDVQTLPGFSTLVIDIDMDNPGVWPLHCHIAWHVSQGLYINILVSAAARLRCCLSERR